MLALQEFLKNTPNWEELLKDRYGVNYKRHPRFPELVQFTYDQIRGEFSEQLVRESRGVILSEKENWKTIARFADKFFNHGEGLAKEIDWSTAEALEKRDGSLVLLYPYSGEWHVATKGSPDASGLVGHYNFTFAELFWKTFNWQGLKPPEDTNLSLAFELTSFYNRIVVPYKDASVTLIGARDLSLDVELYIEAFYGIYPVVKSWPLNTIESILEAVRSLNPLEQEGYVVIDRSFNRIKVKNPGYVALHNMKDGYGPRRIVELIRTAEVDEFTAVFPEFRDEILRVKVTYDKLIQEVEETYQRIKDIPVRKDFALEATKTRFPAVLFSLYSGKSPSAKSFFSQVSIQSLMSLLGVKDVISGISPQGVLPGTGSS